MKKIGLIICAALAVSCGANKKKSNEEIPAVKESYTILGTLNMPNEDSTIVYLRDGETEDTLLQALVVDSSFVIKGELEKPFHARIAYSMGTIGAAIPLFVEKGEIKFDADRSNASGTPLNDGLNEYYREASKIKAPLRVIQEKMDALPANASNKDREALDLEYANASKSVSDSILKLRVATYEKNQDNILGAFIFSDFPMELFKERYESTSQTIKDFYFVERRKIYYDALENTIVGKKFADFTIEKGNLDGTPAKLSDYAGKGKVILVDFWASWCGPCRGETPNIREVYNKYHGDRFDILSVAVWDKREDTMKAIEEDKITWNCMLDDPDGLSAQAYAIEGIPHILLIGADGTILARDLRGKAIGAAVAKALAE